MSESLKRENPFDIIKFLAPEQVEIDIDTLDLPEQVKDLINKLLDLFDDEEN